MSKLTNPCRKTIATFEMLRSGKPVKFADLVSRMGCKEITVMTYICSLRNNFGAEIETVRDGRKVVAYTLANPDAVAPKMVSKSATKTPKVKAAKPIVAKVAVTKSRKTVATKAAATAVADEIPTLDVEEIDSDTELESLKAELGLSESYSE